MEDEGRGKEDSSTLGRKRGIRGNSAKTNEGSEGEGEGKSSLGEMQ
jgi:hypothetical protein